MKTTPAVASAAIMASYQGAAEGFAQKPSITNMLDLMETMLVQHALRGDAITKEQHDALFAKLGVTPAAQWNAVIYKEMGRGDIRAVLRSFQAALGLPIPDLVE